MHLVKRDTGADPLAECINEVGLARVRGTAGTLTQGCIIETRARLLAINVSTPVVRQAGRKYDRGNVLLVGS